MASDKKVLLVILDGWGLSGVEEGNAPLKAKTPTLDFVYQNYPKTSLSASGISVGLSDGDPGNSEVGHLNIGTGRVVWESLPRINQDIESKSLEKNETLQQLADYSRKNNKTVHMVGLVSDGGVHAHIDHLILVCKILNDKKVAKIRIHFISDGRDTDPEAAARYLAQIESELSSLKDCRVATMVGRYFAMDRDKNWDRVKQATDLFFDNKGLPFVTGQEAITQNYNAKKDDESMSPTVIGEGGKIEAGDAVLLFNYRADRAKQLLMSMTPSTMLGAAGINPPKDLYVVTMTQYIKDQSAPVIFPPINLENTLPELISRAGLTQFHTAETEKFAHVTYFFNAGKETSQQKEIDLLVPSKKVESYSKVPEMSAKEITDKLTGAMKENINFVVVNYANGDMVGHTGSEEGAIKACEAVDHCLNEVFATASKQGYKVILTADHGNCEKMIDEVSKKPNKEHTSNPVPMLFMDFLKRPYVFVETTLTKEEYTQYSSGTPIGVLADIAPSVLANLGVDKLGDMSGMDLTIAMI